MFKLRAAREFFSPLKVKEHTCTGSRRDNDLQLLQPPTQLPLQPKTLAYMLSSLLFVQAVLPLRFHKQDIPSTAGALMFIFHELVHIRRDERRSKQSDAVKECNVGKEGVLD